MRKFLLGNLLLIVCLSSGCVERRFRIESNPPGAQVRINGKLHGPTPIDIPFQHYGDYHIELLKGGYETRTTVVPIDTPWYQRPPIDFISEVLWPWQITDIRQLNFDLPPNVNPTVDELKAEAEELRNQAKEMPPPRRAPTEKTPTPTPEPPKSPDLPELPKVP